MFWDDDLAPLCTRSNGRTSVPPSLLAKALLLQSNCPVSDAEATARTRFDIRRKVAVGIGASHEAARRLGGPVNPKFDSLLNNRGQRGP